MEKSKDQLNAEADVVKTTTSNQIENFAQAAKHVPIIGSWNSEPINSLYVSKAIPTIIKFSSRASVKVKDNFYTIEYGEERQIPNYLETDIDKERIMLIEDCNNQVDRQIEEIVKTFLK